MLSESDQKFLNHDCIPSYTKTYSTSTNIEPNMNKETYTKWMKCLNCKSSWLQEIPVGYTFETDLTTNEPYAKDQDSVKERRFDTCPTCKIKGQTRWE